MTIGILGAGAMAQALSRHFIRRGHKLLLSYSRDQAKLEQTVRNLGYGTRVGSPRQAADFGEVVILATGWYGVWVQRGDEAVDAGALSAARFIEPTMLLLVHLAYRQKLGSIALRLLRHPTTN
jgi:predicted dinucleotide-binding enzyme